MANSSKSTKDLVASINKAMGGNVVGFGSDVRFEVEYLPTGLLPFDILFQGGIPRGRFIMVQGDWSTLKSYVGLCAIAKVQDEGGIAGIIDTEHAFDPVWARSIGVDVDNLMIERPESGELAIDTAEAMIRANVDLIVIDSVSATLPQAERDKRLHKENIQPGRQAALMSAACRRLTAANTTTAVMWINQMRENIGMTFGPREKATGGRALPYYSSIIVEIRKTGRITRDEQTWGGDKWQNTKVQIGQKFKAEVLKSKLNKPYREVWFNWSLTDSAIDQTGFMIGQGLELGAIKTKGNTWIFGNLKVVGREKFATAVRNTPKVRVTLEDIIRVHHGLIAVPVHTNRVSKTPTLSKKPVLNKKKSLSKR